MLLYNIDIVINVPVAIVDVMIDVPVSIVFGAPMINRGGMVTDLPVSANIIFLYWLMNSH